MKLNKNFNLAAISVAVMTIAGCNSSDNDDQSAPQATVGDSTCPTSEFIQIIPGFKTDDGKDVCGLKGYMPYGSLTLTADKVWALNGPVYIGDDQAGAEDEGEEELREYEGLPTGYSDAVVAADDSNHINRDTKLVVEAGTMIMGADGPDALVIQRDAQIVVNGTKEAPVVMTSGLDIDGEAKDSDRGKWGGLVINGNANNNKGSDIVGEGFTGKYGRLNDDTYDQESSGKLNYLVVKYAGFQFTPENELNGVAFQAVGAGTEVDYLQVHNNSDDGVEFFGGTVNAKHLVLTGNDDDSMDWTYGWTGKAQYVFIEQTAQSGDKGIEADSHKGDLVGPQSNPHIANLTILAADGNKGMETRVATNATFYNALVKTTGKCVDFDNAETVSFMNSAVECGTVVEDKDNKVDDVVVEVSVESLFDDSNNTAAAITVTGAVATTTGVTAADLSESEFFDNADFVGAVKEGDDWTAGWTQSWK